MRIPRIRTAWKNKGRKISTEERAAAVAAVAWRVALGAAKNLHAREFDYEDGDDAQRLSVIREYIYFLIHIADRRAADALDRQRRAEFITHLCGECRRHYRENGSGIAGEGMSVDELNQRMDGYAHTKFDGDAPGFDALRALGQRVQDCLGASQVNKWAQDQVVEIDGPEAVRIFRKALGELNAAAGVEKR